MPMHTISDGISEPAEQLLTVRVPDFQNLGYDVGIVLCLARAVQLPQGPLGESFAEMRVVVVFHVPRNAVVMRRAVLPRRLTFLPTDPSRTTPFRPDVTARRRDVAGSEVCLLERSRMVTVLTPHGGASEES